MYFLLKLLVYEPAVLCRLGLLCVSRAQPRGMKVRSRDNDCNASLSQDREVKRRVVCRHRAENRCKSKILGMSVTISVMAPSHNTIQGYCLGFLLTDLDTLDWSLDIIREGMH